MAGSLHMYTIYHLPKDDPHTYMVKAWEIASGSDPIPGDVLGHAPYLEDARALVPVEADHCLTRNDGDDPTIVETWL